MKTDCSASSRLQIGATANGKSARQPFGDASLGWRKVAALSLALWLAQSAHVHAHDPGLSTATVILDSTQVEACLLLAPGDAALALGRDANVGWPPSGNAAVALNSKAAGALELFANGQALLPVDAHLTFDANHNANVRLRYRAAACSNLTVRSKWLAQLPPGHRQFLTVCDATGASLGEGLLSANVDVLTVHASAPSGAAVGGELASKPATQAASQGFLSFLKLGIEHILHGYDHLLFLFALLIVTRHWQASLKIITCFTVAHSLTLAMATFNLVTLPGRVVEPIIAASIIYVGVQNLIGHEGPRGRWVLTFAFGLIHGFGFASVLSDLGVGVRAGGVAWPLFSFNLGVELGQIVVAAIVLPIIWQLRKKEYFVQRGVPVCSTMVALAGTFWFLQRVWAG